LRTAEEDGADLISRRKLRDLGRQKVDPVEDVTVGEGTDAPDKPL